MTQIVPDRGTEEAVTKGQFETLWLLSLLLFALAGIVLSNYMLLNS